jgi:hypothetical protein
MGTCLEDTGTNQEKLETKMETYPEEMEANQEEIEAIAEHYEGVPCVKAMQLLTTLQDRLPVFCMEPPKDRHLRRED